MYVYFFLDYCVVKPQEFDRLSAVSKIVLICMTVAQLSRSWRRGGVGRGLMRLYDVFGQKGSRHVMTALHWY